MYGIIMRWIKRSKLTTKHGLAANYHREGENLLFKYTFYFEYS